MVGIVLVHITYSKVAPGKTNSRTGSLHEGVNPRHLCHDMLVQQVYINLVYEVLLPL